MVTYSFNPKTGEVTYTPNAGFIGNDSFGFEVTDSHNRTSNIGIVSISVSNQSSTSSALVSTLLDKGLALANSGNYIQAIQYYDKVLAIDPNETVVLDDKGMALNNLGNYTQAIQYYSNPNLQNLA